MLSGQDLAAVPGFNPRAELGRGGQGIAVRGDLNGQDVVLKVIFPQAFNQVAWEHAKRAARISHKNVVPIDEFGIVSIGGDQYHFVRMPYVAGRRLTEEMQRRRWSVADLREKAAELAEGVGAFHVQNQIHRDIKPDNVLVRASDGAFVLVDLDLVRYDDFATLTGRHGLTYGYAAPEHAQGDRCSERSDLFEFGILLAELLAGRHPYGSGSPTQRQDRINRGEQPDPLPWTVPADIAALVRSLLANRVADRPRSADVVAAALRRATPRGRAWLSDIAMGARVGKDSEAPTRANLSRLDIVVVEARLLPNGFAATNWRPPAGLLLIDPTTDLLAIGAESQSFRVNAAAWGWAPAVPSYRQVLSVSVDDTRLSETILGWQIAQGADALISPYIRVSNWPNSGPTDLDRLVQLARAASAVARAKWPGIPFLAAAALADETLRDGIRRDQVLAALTGLDNDGVYLVAEKPKPVDRKSHMEAIRDFGETLHRSDRLAIYAYGGSELSPLLASGAWDAVITGTSQSQRARNFDPRQWGRGVSPRRLFATAILDDVEETLLDKVVDLDVGLISCGCNACTALFPAGKPMAYRHDRAASHYLAAQQGWVRRLRGQPPATRVAWLRTELDAALIRAETIDQTKWKGRRFKLSAAPRIAEIEDALL